MSAKKRIGVLTSGGDCAGLNALIRAIVICAAESKGWEVVGIRQGTAGLLARPVEAEVLSPASFTGDFLRRAGTLLGTTNKGDPFDYPMPDGSRIDRSGEIIEGLQSLGLDALIGIGGDGSLAILRRLASQGDFNLVAVPKTIDNDLGHTEISIGHATAVDVATDALDHLQPTAASHARIMVLEVMGRDAGHIALNAGIAGGADIILIPEIPYRIEHLADKVRRLQNGGRNFALAIVAEAVAKEDGSAVTTTRHDGTSAYGGIGHYIGQRLGEATGAETRVTVLGYLQRGGMPSPQDRLIASIFGVRAVELIAEGQFDRMVAWSGREVIDVPIEAAIARYHAVDPNGDLVKAARSLDICLGDA